MEKKEFEDLEQKKTFKEMITELKELERSGKLENYSICVNDDTYNIVNKSKLELYKISKNNFK